MLHFLNNISIGRRLLSSVVLFLLTLGFATYGAYTSIGANIDFATQEKKGNVYQRPLSGLLLDTGKLRIELAKFQVGHGDDAALQAALKAINSGMKGLQQVQAEVGEDLQFTDEGLKSRSRENLDMGKVQAKWQALADAVGKSPKGDYDTAVASFIADLRGMVAHSGDTSNLILDPDLDSYYLMDITLLALPQTLDRLSVIGATLYPQLDASHTMTQAERTEAAVMARMLSESDVTRIDGDVDTSLKEDKNFYGVSQSYQDITPTLRADYDAKNKALIDMLQDIAAGKDVTAQALAATVEAAQDSGYAFLTRGYDELDQLLTYRTADYRQQQVKSILISLAGMIVSLVFFLLVMRTVTRPLGELTQTMLKLAGNDLTVTVAYAEARSEIGAMAGSIQTFKDNARKIQAMQMVQAEKDRQAELEKKQAVADLAAGFEASVGKIVQTVAAASAELQGNAASLSDISSRTGKQTAAVSAASEESSVSVQVVASAAEELSSSIGEISRQVDSSVDMIAQAVTHIDKTNETVRGLADSSTRIGAVVQLINDIAGQTNLLALNATIEAARAGEAGKGFAVVASEVKNLAGQTGRATEEISASITSMQEVAAQVVQAIQTVSDIVGRINGVSGNIAAAVTQQSAATREIAKNIEQVSTSTTQVSDSIAMVTEGAGESQRGATRVLDAADALSQQSTHLKQEVDQFLGRIRQS